MVQTMGAAVASLLIVSNVQEEIEQGFSSRAGLTQYVKLSQMKNIISQWMVHVLISMNNLNPSGFSITAPNLVG